MHLKVHNNTAKFGLSMAYMQFLAARSLCNLLGTSFPLLFGGTCPEKLISSSLPVVVIKLKLSFHELTCSCSSFFMSDIVQNATFGHEWHDYKGHLSIKAHPN